MANLLREKYAYSFKKFTAQLYKNTVAYSFHFNATILPITLFYTFSTVTAILRNVARNYINKLKTEYNSTSSNTERLLALI